MPLGVNEMRVDVYTHHFSISEMSRIEFEDVIAFTKPFLEYTLERIQTSKGPKIVQKLSKTYCFSNHDNSVFNFHISSLGAFVNQFDLNKGFKLVKHSYELKDAAKAKFNVKKLFEPRDYQEKLIKQCTETDSNNIAITLQAGGGKTLVAKHVMNILSVRTLIVMKGGYLDRWIPDLEESFKLRKGELLTVRGNRDLRNIMEMNEYNELNANIIMTTIDTLANYFQEYSKTRLNKELWSYSPTDFFKKMGIGLVILDEGHQNPHKVMRVFSHTHVPRFITLSATLETTESFKNKMYEAMFPYKDRIDGGYKNVYIGLNTLFYNIENMRGIRYTGYMRNYSHVNFEQSILKRNGVTKRYLGLVKYAVDMLFMEDYKPKTKCLLFFATVAMCDKAVKYLKEKYPKLKISRYTSADKMSVMDKADIIVSTVLSAGTAVDIINLRTTIMTTAINSQISNEQSLYRTRPIKDYPDITPTFNYFACNNIERHLDYHKSKLDFFKGKVKYHNTITLPYPV